MYLIKLTHINKLSRKVMVSTGTHDIAQKKNFFVNDNCIKVDQE